MDNLVEVCTLNKGDEFTIPGDSNYETYIYEGISPNNKLEVKAIRNFGFATAYFPRYRKVHKINVTHN